MIQILIDPKSIDKLDRKITLLPAKIKSANKRAMKRSVKAVASHIVKNKLRGNPLHSRTAGAAGMAGNISYNATRPEAVRVINDEVIGEVKNSTPYANIHEHGGTITPKRAKYLTIPLSGNLTERGVMRVPPKSVVNAFFATSKKGNLIMFGESPLAGGEIVPMFVLKDKVVIPARPYMEPAAQEKRSEIINFFSEEIRREAEAN